MLIGVSVGAIEPSPSPSLQQDYASDSCVRRGVVPEGRLKIAQDFNPGACLDRIKRGDLTPSTKVLGYFQ